MGLLKLSQVALGVRFQGLRGCLQGLRGVLG
jgi:hypothetical protein